MILGAKEKRELLVKVKNLISEATSLFKGMVNIVILFIQFTFSAECFKGGPLKCTKNILFPPSF